MLLLSDLLGLTDDGCNPKGEHTLLHTFTQWMAHFLQSSDLNEVEFSPAEGAFHRRQGCYSKQYKKNKAQDSKCYK